MRFVLLALCACSLPSATPAQLASRETPAPAPVVTGRCVNGRFDVRDMQGRAELGFVADHVNGDLDKSIIRRAIHDHTAELQACYASYLERGSQAGRVNARFTIIGDGSVGDAWVTGFDDELADCVCEIVATMQFLPTRGGAITVTYPFSFAPAR